MTFSGSVAMPGHLGVEWVLVAAAAIAISRAAKRSSGLVASAQWMPLLLAGFWLVLDGYQGATARLATIALITLARRRGVGAAMPETPSKIVLRAAAALFCGWLVEQTVLFTWLFAAFALHSGFRRLFAEEEGDAETRIGIGAREVAECFAVSAEPFVVFCGTALLPGGVRSRPDRARSSALGAALAVVGVAPLVEGWTSKLPPEAILAAVGLLLAFGEIGARRGSRTERAEVKVEGGA